MAGNKVPAAATPVTLLLWPVATKLPHHVGGTQARLVGTDLKKMFCPRPEGAEVRGPALDRLS